MGLKAKRILAGLTLSLIIVGVAGLTLTLHGPWDEPPASTGAEEGARRHLDQPASPKPVEAAEESSTANSASSDGLYSPTFGKADRTSAPASSQDQADVAPTKRWTGGRSLGQRTEKEPANEFSFAATADSRLYSGPGRYDTPQFFRGALEAIANLGSSDFMVSPGDIDPLTSTYWTITRTLGTDYSWYPAVGNHELPGLGTEDSRGDNITWLESYNYGPVNPGPSGCPVTTYSFDYRNVHFVVLNEYCDVGGNTVTSGDVPDHLFYWLVDDLNNTDQEHVFVFGHEPAYPQPDEDNGRVRHVGDSLDQHPAHRDRFWDLLRRHRVTAYVCGHTHNYSAVEIDGVWQIDVGHARGLGDTGARSTFVIFHVDGDSVWFDTYRDDAAGGPYTHLSVGVIEGHELFVPIASHDGKQE